MAATYRLKLPGGWLQLPPGSYEIGRSAHCQVILEGAKVSRLHARLSVEPGGVSVEDLGSANGVFVNGKRIRHGRQSLEPGDQILVGEHALELRTGTVSTPAPVDARSSNRPTLLDSIPVQVMPSVATTKAHALDLLGSVAARAIASGDARRAEAILGTRLDEVLQSAKEGVCDDLSRSLAMEHSLALAEAMPSAKWLDFAVELLGTTRTLPSEKELDLLDAASKRVSGADARKLQDYTAMVGAMQSSLEKVRAVGRLQAVLAAVSGRR